VKGEKAQTGRPADSESGAVAALSDARVSRLNYGRLPQPGSGSVPYANCRPELAGLTDGERVALVAKTASWARVMEPILDELEASRPRKGPTPAYTSHELELALLFTWMSGVPRYSKARTLLAGDRGGRCRRALGFDRPRPRVGRNLRVVESLDGVPSEKTVWRHVHRFGVKRHRDAYAELMRALVDEGFTEFPEEMAAECELVDFDGSADISRYCSFERKVRKTGEVKPPTMTGGGFRPRTKDNAGKDGHGYTLCAAVTSTGLPLMARIVPLNQPEGRVAASMLREEWAERIAPHLTQTEDRIGVMAFDSAYSGRDVRTAVHEAGYVPNCHAVSHARRERSEANARRHNKYEFDIEGKPGWKANGHRELMCVHGTLASKRDFRRKKSGEVVTRVEGNCAKGCGHISITAGEWRPAQHPKRFVRVMPGDEDRADWKMGNPLTYNNKVSESYGEKRFGHNEGFHGALVTRFGLLKDKSWHRSREQAERNFFAVFCIMHSLAMEQRRRAAAARALAPPEPTAGAPPPGLAKAA
jgi:hypothetical protein